MKLKCLWPAPSQQSLGRFFYGVAGGMLGFRHIDYFIGDPVATPLSHAAHYTECIAQMPHCYQPNDAHRLRPAASCRADWEAPEDKVLLCAFHQSYKISQQVFHTWCRILATVPGSVLWLLLRMWCRRAASNRILPPQSWSLCCCHWLRSLSAA